MEDARSDAQRRVEMMAEARRVEAEAAQKLIDAFIVDAAALGLAPEPLRATTYAGASLKTDREGWYLNARRTLAIGTDAGYYRLLVPGSALARFTGVKLTPEPPPLLVGANGKDGEGGELSWFLDRVLQRGA